MEWLDFTEAGEAPSARTGHKVEYSPSSDSLLMFGGADDDGAMFSLRLTELGSAAKPTLTWSRLEIANTPPLARSFHTLNLIDDRLFVFAGKTVEENVSDLYICTKGRWCRPLYDGQINVRGHASAVLHDKLIVFGGVRDHADRPSRPVEDKPSEDSQAPTSRYQRISKKLFFLNVLEIRDEAADGDFKFKLVTVGDSGVGKSCLLTRFVQDVYSDFHVSTIGVDFKSIVSMIKGKLCTLQLWDTAGQERFSGVTGNYYRNADGFVLVYDATRRESFDHIEQWMEQIQEHHECGPGTVKLLIGNKSDLVPQLQVTEAEARKVADKIGAMYVTTSAKTASNVDAAFLSAANKLVENRRRQGQARKATSMGGGTSIEGGGGRVSLGSSGGPARGRAATGGCGGCAGGGGGGGFGMGGGGEGSGGRERNDRTTMRDREGGTSRYEEEESRALTAGGGGRGMR
eukprot:GHVQ01003149.1.p1 GENE.GHVQ01003149.1~~GHVQ01003149.1.p1  ORF type:complete len:459 (+),score=69.55 GHVQ01003149.1:1291-2667(+)